MQTLVDPVDFRHGLHSSYEWNPYPCIGEGRIDMNNMTPFKRTGQEDVVVDPNYGFLTSVEISQYRSTATVFQEQNFADLLGIS